MGLINKREGIMSEYAVVEVKFKDEGCLVQSLKEMGYKPEIHKSGVVLSNSYSRSNPTAHVVVRKGQFGGYGDIGFERTKKGFVMHADNSDGRKFKLKQLNKTYSETKIKRYVGSTANCNIFSRRENEKGQIEIHLRIQK